MTAVGRRYAAALFELAKNEGKLDQCLADMRALGEAWGGSAELRAVVADPSVSNDILSGALDIVLGRLGTGELVKNTVGVMAARGRLAQLPEVAEAFETLAEAGTGRVRAEVVTAKPMSEAYYAELKAKLEQVTGTQVVLTKKEDRSIIAGVIARVGDQVFDGSVRNRLQDIKEELLR